MFIVFVILTAGLLVLRVPYAVLAAAGIAVLDFLPMLGTGTILIPWAVLWALSGKLSSAAGLVILYAVTQVTRQLIQPKMVGDSIGMDAMTTLIFLFIGYRMAGLIGMIVAIPSGLILIQLYEAGAFVRCDCQCQGTGGRYAQITHRKIKKKLADDAGFFSITGLLQ